VSAVSSGSSTSSRKIIAIICIVVAVLFIVLGLVYAIEPAKSLPSIMGSKGKGTGHHALRMAASFIVGIVFAAAAWVSMAYKPKGQAAPSNNTSDSTPVNH
jgi:formate hydrogenlyase subunit 3/multisubunit Na+/H+ antiporter MnhD subunit